MPAVFTETATINCSWLEAKTSIYHVVSTSLDEPVKTILI